MNKTHTVPAIDRMMGVLGSLALHEDGLSLDQVAVEAGLPRSTVYRLLNSMEAHSLVSRHGGQGRFVIGTGFLRLAARVQQRLCPRNLVAIAHPYLSRLSARTGEVSKLSVLDGDRALCVAAVAGASPYSLTPLTGEHYPIHAGAASKILLAAQPAAERTRILACEREAFTPRTITARSKVEAELERVRRQGWAQDAGEFKLSVRAVAAPVTAAGKNTVAALSIAYLDDLHAEKGAVFRDDVVAAARELSDAASLAM